MAGFFLERPVLAWVVSIMIMLVGALALRTLPVAQYPDIAPPQISVSCRYPGATAKVVDQSVTQVIEQQMKGLDNLIYMRSSSESSGNAEMVFTFESGTDSDIAQVQVQNKLQQAMPQLPEEVQRQGVVVSKAVENSFMIVAFFVPDGGMTVGQIGDYVGSVLLDPLSRLQGVGSVTLYGSMGAMRIWCDPEKLEQYRLNPQDVIAAVRQQNVQVAGGQVGAAPALAGQKMNIAVNAASRLETVEEFERIRVRTERDGSVLRLKDVARVEVGDESFTFTSWYNGHPAVGIAFKLASGANVLDVTKRIKEELRALSNLMPAGMEYAFADDRAPVVEQSITAVVWTLFEAVVLVVAVMFLFMQSLRATFIPAVAVPVVLLGVFAVLAAFRYSINTLTMFGMVLAIGLLVDDAIVVVENVERLMRRENLSPKEAAAKTMRQITGALVGVAVVISAVFVPMAFMSGSTGVIYRQFSITIVTAMALSVVVAVVLTPTLCASMLHSAPVVVKEGFFSTFNRWFEAVAERYSRGVRAVVSAPKRLLVLFVGIVAASGALFAVLPTAFLPPEDLGVIYVDAQLPPGASFERTEKVLRELNEYFKEHEKEAVEDVYTIMGFGFSGSGQSAGILYVKLRDWSKRGKGQSAFDVMNRASARFSDIPGANIYAIAPPAVMELGVSSGFDLELMDRSGRGREEHMNALRHVLRKAYGDPNILYARYSGQEDAEQYVLRIDMDKAGAQGLSQDVVNGAVGAYWGGEYVNDFVHNGRTKKVYLQAEPAFRRAPEDFSRYYARNDQGEMTPFSSFITVASSSAPPTLTRYQGSPSLKIEGEAAPGKSSGQAMRALEAAAEDLPQGFGFAWTGLSFQEARTGSQAPMLYALSLAVVFLSLAALYESWTIPLAVLLAVPTGVIGSLAGVYLFSMNNDIYFQIALLTIVGLSAKNSILIVEFARNMHRDGMDLVAASVEASRLRFRPIIMTSLCFILGVAPLAAGSGAGSGAQNAIGVAVVAGMLAATSLGVYYTPLFFVLTTRAFARKKQTVETPAVAPNPAE